MECSALDCEKIPQQIVTRFCQETFRVELDTVYREVAVLQAHDFERLPVIVDPGRDFKAVGDRIFRYDEAVVASRLERIRQS